MENTYYTTIRNIFNSHGITNEVLDIDIAYIIASEAEREALKEVSTARAELIYNEGVVTGFKPFN